MRLAKLGEIPTVYSNHNPAVRQTMVVPFKLLHIFELTFRHGCQAYVSARNHLFAPTDYPQEDAALHSYTLSESHCRSNVAEAAERGETVEHYMEIIGNEQRRSTRNRNS